MAVPAKTKQHLAEVEADVQQVVGHYAAVTRVIDFSSAQQVVVQVPMLCYEDVEIQKLAL